VVKQTFDFFAVRTHFGLCGRKSLSGMLNFAHEAGRVAAFFIFSK